MPGLRKAGHLLRIALLLRIGMSSEKKRLLRFTSCRQALGVAVICSQGQLLIRMKMGLQSGDTRAESGKASLLDSSLCKKVLGLLGPFLIACVPGYVAWDKETCSCRWWLPSILLDCDGCCFSC